MNVKYTFLLPAYKTAFLEEMLHSIQNQTYKSFKVLISDDCSPEPIREICEHYLSDPRFSYRRNDENMGCKRLVAHWNLLVDMCDTEFLVMASDDDVYAPTFLEEIDKLQTRYLGVDLLRARANIIDKDGLVLKKDALYEECVNQLDYLEQLDFYNHIECIANYVFNTKALKKCGGFVDFPLAWSSDTATTNLLSSNGVANTKDILFSFRMSGMNISSQELNNRNMSQKKFKSLCLYDDFMLNLFKTIRTDGTKLQEITLQRVITQHKKRISGLMGWYSCTLPVGDFIRYVKTYRKRGYINSLFLIVKRRILMNKV